MGATENIETKEKEACYHCGDKCLDTSIFLEEKVFCCQGCKTVFEILSLNDLSDYYQLEKRPGISMRTKSSNRFEYLDSVDVIDKLVDFQDDKLIKVQLYLPQIHCSACLWLLENLYKINPAVQQTRVNFLKKEAYITFNHEVLSLRELVELLDSIGYEPNITLDSLEQSQKRSISKRLIYQVGLAGFAFGNIMLLSLPEYFGLDLESFQTFSPWFAWLNLILATPVALYSGQDYFSSAFKSLKQKRLNIDVPIALGVFVLYLRSAYEIISETGAGYFDSLCGLLFFLLLGRIFQEKIYHRLSFERDYRSYFPVVVTKIKNQKEEHVSIEEIEKGDKILIRNGELIPVDAYLIQGNARIDNSFATGEAEPIKMQIGDKIYAGGRQVGEGIQLEVIRPLNQSNLTRLWNDYSAKKSQEATFSRMTDKVSEWFTPIILLIALFSGAYHLQFGWGHALEVMSAVLIVACPCALALSAPFTFGHTTRWLGSFDCYLRDAGVIEELAKINHIVFDKTGTLTYGQNQKVNYQGVALNESEIAAVWNLVNQSNHPISRLIKNSFPQQNLTAVEDFQEIDGKGILGKVNGDFYRLGSYAWLGDLDGRQEGTSSLLEVNGILKGSFSVANEYRSGLKELLEKLALMMKLSMLSGDNESQKEKLGHYFPNSSVLLFNQSPEQKLKAIESLQTAGDQVMMVGDGLNDAGALRTANVGVVIAEDVNSFSPACDVILKANRFEQLDKILEFAKSSKRIVIVSFIISFLYNLVGLGFAVQGLLSPVFAAILMPISSISVVAFVSVAVWVYHFRFKR